MVWAWALRWLHPRNSADERTVADGYEDDEKEETVASTLQKSQAELHLLESKIDSIKTTLTRCKEALAGLSRKELQLREALEEFMMEMHDCGGSGPSSSQSERGGTAEGSLNNSNTAAQIWELLAELQQKREQLQERNCRLEITLRCLEAEKGAVEDSLEKLEIYVPLNAVLHAEDEVKAQRVPLHPPPVKVEIVEEARRYDGECTS
ncbi:hypothetical protein DQ04_04121050 [Trypanosoma grayi]|uniref:hypothetical protein n=1 Tax=Trypanosoma grayi TaxID=71804 RepID=UPI0004F4A289|nr:hypothetical protein DQ04_04121050 [Trypanosoma grayi]KEG10147.1 hypothetical protein DQ04_04121050 [Trypanosoma grayi]